ncbi:putative transcription factor spt20 [Golovinomyces cichoracearum]|uniref:Putative transcription factor spt20 n=1 Tax=Golovinomyces cichoracearum TaxID=62708 RepID=A0A420HJL1_9PEZI|nr:putative transcription factor spt20 [Golovinomyces cichoracearum]
MAPSATGTQSISSKLKRLVTTGIQTNGIQNSTPSPLISGRLLPSSAKPTLNSAGNNVTGNNSPPIRSADHWRDAPYQHLSRAQGNSGAELRSVCSMGDSAMLMINERQPYIKSDEYILKKYRNNSPSLIIHLHPTHFRFDNQEGHFPYQSPMRIMIEHLRQRTIPHDLVEYFGDIPYYEECLIVQIHDHKSIASSQPPERDKSPKPKQVLFSILNHSPYCTPSPYAPQETQKTPKNKSSLADKSNTDNAEQHQKNDVPSSTTPTPGPLKPKILTVVLHPTPLSRFVDLAIKTAETFCTEDTSSNQQERKKNMSTSVPANSTASVPLTPQASMAPPAKRVKRSKVNLDSNHIYSLEAQLNLATTAPLFLEPVSNAFESAALLECLTHPMHEEKPPAPKIRKRTVAEMAADEAFAAEQERYMLLLDERISSSAVTVPGGISSAGTDDQSGGIVFEARFERFKLIETIRSQYEANKRLEKIKTAENEKRQRQETEKKRVKDEADKRVEQEKKAAAQLKQAQAQRQAAENHWNSQLLADQANLHQQIQGLQNQVENRNQNENQNQTENPNEIKNENENESESESESENLNQIKKENENENQNQTQTQAQSQPQSQNQPQHTQSQQNSQSQHSHPPNSGALNAIPGQPQRFHQQISLARASSPINRTGTPQNKSSPTVNSLGGVPMQSSASSNCGSPRPGSIIQQSQQQKAALTSHGMTSQISQQSHTSTPRITASTPAQSTPINRQISQKPRITLGSPSQAQIANLPQGAKTQAMNAQPIISNATQAQVFQQQRVQQILRQQQQQQAFAQGIGGMMQAQQMARNPQQQPVMLRQSMQGYSAAQMADLAQRQASQNSMNQGINRNFMSNVSGMNNMPQQISLSVQQIQQLQQQQLMRQAHAQQMAAQQQQAIHGLNPQAGMTQAVRNQIMGLAQRIYQAEKAAFTSQNPNVMINDNLDRQMRARAQNTAQQQYAQARRRQQMVAAQAAQAAQAQQNGMQHSMGM